MSQEYNITGNSNKSILKDISSNTIPLNIPNRLQSVVPSFIKIPHPTISQVLLDNLPIYRIKPNTNTQDSEVSLSRQLGTPVMDVLYLIALTSDVEGKLQPSSTPIHETAPIQETGDGHTIISLDDVLITVSQRKKIVITDIAGNNQGTVKEYIGLSDYEINITGRLNGNYNKRPVEDLQNLKTVLDLGKTIGVTSVYLSDLKIENVVVVDYNLPQIMGEYSTQYFTINLLSDNMPDEKFITFF